MGALKLHEGLCCNITEIILSALSPQIILPTHLHVCHVLGQIGYRESFWEGFRLK